MKTFTTLRNTTANYCSVNSSTDTTAMGIIDTNLNDSIRTISNIRSGKWRWLESLKTIDTVASQASYQIPNRFRKVMDVYITVSSTIYRPIMIFDPTKWALVLSARLGECDVPRFTYIEDKKLFIYPTPASSGNTISIRGRDRISDLAIADYTTGTITSLTKGESAIIADSTVFTADMVGRFIRITQTTAAKGGDGQWYEIGKTTNATTITILKPYEGTTLVGATASFIIGQVSNIPEAYDIAIVYRSSALYWQQQGDLSKADRYWRLYDGGNEAGLSREYGGIIGQMLENEGETEEGAWIPPFDSRNDSHVAPYYQPYDQASGFN